MNNNSHFNLIVPAASDNPDSCDSLPRIFSLDENGIMLCVKAVTGLNLEIFDKTYYTILKKHVDSFNIDEMLRFQFKKTGLSNAEIIILDEPTASQAQTVAESIETRDISGAVFIKDADSYFKAEIYPENGVAVYPIELLELVDPRHKSYVAVDDMNHITNIIEKRVVSNLFSAGGYCFKNTESFMSTYKKYCSLGPLYLSHIIYALLLSGEPFRPIPVTDYCDFDIPLIFQKQMLGNK